jgi:AcrR family transcriptional regulator
MAIKISFKVNEAVFLRDPEKSELGRAIIKNSIELINNLGFEAFTFKKLAIEMGTTEATIYRYFENKHRLLLYIISWYWKYMDFLLDFQLQNLTDHKVKLKTIIKLLTHELPISTGELDYNIKFLNQIVITESSKVYLVKEVNEINKSEVFKPYKELCAKIAAVISANNKKYPYPKSLSSTIIEASHHQQFFCQHLPRLTDVTAKNKNEFACLFIENLVFGVLGN